MPRSPVKQARLRNRQIFINCPFSNDYQDNFRAIVFSIIRSGFTPRCALEADDGAETRFSKICRIIKDCDLAVHDISKTELDPGSGLRRFNMPLELGLFLGAKQFGSGENRKKCCIIFDREKYRYQAFISDIAGQDIHAHGGNTANLIGELASWLRAESHDPAVPGGKIIAAEFWAFQDALPDLCGELRLELEEMTFQDYRQLATGWIQERAASGQDH